MVFMLYKDIFLSSFNGKGVGIPCLTYLTWSQFILDVYEISIYLSGDKFTSKKKVEDYLIILVYVFILRKIFAKVGTYKC